MANNVLRGPTPCHRPATHFLQPASQDRSNRRHPGIRRDLDWDSMLKALVEPSAEHGSTSVLWILPSANRSHYATRPPVAPEFFNKFFALLQHEEAEPNIFFRRR